MNSLLASSSPAGSFVGLEYVWTVKSPVPHAFDIRSDWTPNPGIPLGTYCSQLPGHTAQVWRWECTTDYRHGGALPAILSVDGPSVEGGGSKFVSTVSAAATPHGSRTMLTNVASNPTIALRGRAGRLSLLERRIASTFPGDLATRISIVISRCRDICRSTLTVRPGIVAPRRHLGIRSPPAAHCGFYASGAVCKGS